MKQVEYESQTIDIPLDKLEIGESQIRNVDTGKDIQELADSIKKVGLIQPISVRPTKNGKYEIIAGQRRVIAHRQLKAKTIRAQVVTRDLDELELKLLSLHENMSRLDLSAKDEKDACLILYRRYGDINLIIQETGLPAGKVRKYLKFHSLSSKMQQMVDQGDVGIDEALRAQKAASVSGKFDEEKAVSLAIEMKSMSGAQRSNLEKIFAENPKQSVEAAIEKSIENKVTQITTTISNNLLQSLKKFAKDEGMNQDSAVASLVEEGLTDKGYLD
jgi:ParB family transcriptional regulator, chromosome partitioning protein